MSGLYNMSGLLRRHVLAVGILLLNIKCIYTTIGREDLIRSIFSQRISFLPRQAPPVPCRPDVIPNLANAGFCCSMDDLDALCSTLEISLAVRNCTAFDGNFCCYQSISQGNSLTTGPVGTPVPSLSPTPATNPPTIAPAATSTAQTITSTTSTTTTPPSTTISTTTTSTSTTPTTTSTTPTTPSTSGTTTPLNLVTGPNDPNLLDTSKPEVQQLIVDLHNQVRRNEGAANMLKMQWDPVAASVAQEWANRCVAQHGPPVRNGTTFSGCGQNIANGNGIQSWNFTVQIWGPNEKKLFTFGLEPCPNDFYEVVGHYTQIVWYRTWTVGCGFAACPNPVGNFFVCNYCPAGNVGAVCAPYLPGTAENGGVCGKCGGINSPNSTPCSFTNQFSNCDAPDPGNPTLFPALIPNTDMCSNTNDQFVKACAASCQCRRNNLIY